MARLPLLNFASERIRRAWRRCRATGGDWRAFMGLLVRTLVLAALAGEAQACEIAPMSDCRGAVLSGIDLRRRNLRGIDFAGADLSDSDLRGADLAGANLAGADMRRAIVEKAYLGYAILDGADLAGARLRRRDILATTSLAGARMPDGSRCAGISMGACAGTTADAFRARRRKGTGS